MSTRDLKHPWKPSVWIGLDWIVLGSWLLQGIRVCVKEPFTILCGKLCRIGQDHAEPGEKQDHRIKGHYTNPKNVFPPKSLNPSPFGEVACLVLGWHSGPCPTLT